MKKITHLPAILLVLWSLFTITITVNAQEAEPQLKLMDSTAYYDAYGSGHGVDGSPLIEGLTVAARKQDIGKTAVVYSESWELIGIFVVSDCGYGRSLGYGRSTIKPGRPIGDIEAGECIDIYFKTREACRSWGRRKVYVQLINAEG